MEVRALISRYKEDYVDPRAGIYRGPVPFLGDFRDACVLKPSAEARLMASPGPEFGGDLHLERRD